jgi:hypothetical protein
MGIIEKINEELITTIEKVSNKDITLVANIAGQLVQLSPTPSPTITPTPSPSFIPGYEYYRFTALNSSSGATTDRIMITEIELYTGNNQTGTDYPTTALTSNTSQAGTTVSAGYNLSGYEPWEAFDDVSGNVASSWWSISNNNASNNYLQIQFSSRVDISSAKIWIAENFTEAAVLKIEASNSGNFSGEQTNMGYLTGISDGGTVTLHTIDFDGILPSPSPTPTSTPSVTPSITPTRTPSVTPSITPTRTPSVTPSITPTRTPSVTPSITPTRTPSVTPSITPTRTPSVTPSITPTRTPSVTPSITPTSSPQIAVSNTPTPSITSTPNWTSRGAFISECCTGFNAYTVRVPTNAIVGDIVIYDNGNGTDCYEVISVGSYSTLAVQANFSRYSTCNECKVEEARLSACSAATPTDTTYLSADFSDQTYTNTATFPTGWVKGSSSHILWGSQTYNVGSNGWKFDYNNTGSGGTGPNGGLAGGVDATTGTQNNTNRYMYYEASSTGGGTGGRGNVVVSPQLNFSNALSNNTLKLTFWFHMYGSSNQTQDFGIAATTSSTNSSSSVEVISGAGFTSATGGGLNITYWTNDNGTTTSTGNRISGSQQTSNTGVWRKAEVDLNSLAGESSVYLHFMLADVTYFRSDFAIDGIKLVGQE